MAKRYACRTRTLSPVVLTAGVVLAERRFDSMLVTVWTGDRKSRDQVKHWLHGDHDENGVVRPGRLGLSCEEVQVHSSAGRSYVVWGSPEAMERLKTFGWVKSWEYTSNARVGHQGQGSGPEKVSHMGKARNPRPAVEKPATMPLSRCEVGRQVMGGEATLARRADEVAGDNLRELNSKPRTQTSSCPHLYEVTVKDA